MLILRKLQVLHIIFEIVKIVFFIIAIIAVWSDQVRGVPAFEHNHVLIGIGILIGKSLIMMPLRIVRSACGF